MSEFMKQKTFKVSQVRDLLNQVHNEKITFSRFVEILNETIEDSKKVKPIESDWLKIVNSGMGLNESELATAIKEIGNKVNEFCSNSNQNKPTI
jgi:hypothetical protein